MPGRATLILPVAAVLGLAMPTTAAETDRVVWRGSYTGPYHVAGDCLARRMADVFDGTALMADSPRRLRVGLWQRALTAGQPDASFVIQAAGDGRVEIGWQRTAQLPDAVRLDERARSAAIECGGRSA